MSVISSGNTLFSFGVQSAKGSPQGTPNFTVPWIDDLPFNPTFEVDELRRGGDGRYLVDAFKLNQKHPFSWSCLATPESIAYFLTALLGADTKTGSSDPYTHTITYSADTRDWLTLRKKLDTNIVLQFYDAKMASITISGTAGEEIKVAVEGMAINSLIDTTEDSQDRDADDPFMYSDTEGFFNIVAGGRESFNVHSFSVTVRINSEELKGDQILIADLPDNSIDVEMSCDIHVEDTNNFFKKINYYNTTTVSESLYTGQFQIGARYYNGSSKERLLHITIPKLLFRPVEFPTNSTPGVITQTITGIAEKSGTSVTLISGYSTDAYEAGDFDSPSDAYDATEFCPIVDADGKCDLFCGTENWESAGAGELQTWTGQEAAGSPGGIKFAVTSGNWTTFADKMTDGLKTIKLPKSADNDQLGGDVNFYYHYHAWYYAFGTTDNSDIVVSDDGSVFKGSIGAANLVVSSDGIIGQSGGNPTTSSSNLIDCVVKNAVSTDLG